MQFGSAFCFENLRVSVSLWQNYSDMKITSRDNSLLQRARAVRDGKAEQSIFVEGLRLCEEALRSGLEVEAVIYSEQIAKKDRAARVDSRIGTRS